MHLYIPECEKVPVSLSQRINQHSKLSHEQTVLNYGFETYDAVVRKNTCDEAQSAVQCPQILPFLN